MLVWCCLVLQLLLVAEGGVLEPEADSTKAKAEALTLVVQPKDIIRPKLPADDGSDGDNDDSGDGDVETRVEKPNSILKGIPTTTPKIKVRLLLWNLSYSVRLWQIILQKGVNVECRFSFRLFLFQMKPTALILRHKDAKKDVKETVKRWHHPPAEKRKKEATTTDKWRRRHRFRPRPRSTTTSMTTSPTTETPTSVFTVLPASATSTTTEEGPYASPHVVLPSPTGQGFGGFFQSLDFGDFAQLQRFESMKRSEAAADADTATATATLRSVFPGTTIAATTAAGRGEEESVYFGSFLRTEAATRRSAETPPATRPTTIPLKGGEKKLDFLEAVYDSSLEFSPIAAVAADEAEEEKRELQLLLDIREKGLSVPPLTDVKWGDKKRLSFTDMLGPRQVATSIYVQERDASAKAIRHPADRKEEEEKEEVVQQQPPRRGGGREKLLAGRGNDFRESLRRGGSGSKREEEEEERTMLVVGGVDGGFVPENNGEEEEEIAGEKRWDAAKRGGGAGGEEHQPGRGRDSKLRSKNKSDLIENKAEDEKKSVASVPNSLGGDLSGAFSVHQSRNFRRVRHPYRERQRQRHQHQHQERTVSPLVTVSVAKEGNEGVLYHPEQATSLDEVLRTTGTKADEAGRGERYGSRVQWQKTVTRERTRKEPLEITTYRPAFNPRHFGFEEAAYEGPTSKYKDRTSTTAREKMTPTTTTTTKPPTTTPTAASTAAVTSSRDGVRDDLFGRPEVRTLPPRRSSRGGGASAVSTSLYGSPPAPRPLSRLPGLRPEPGEFRPPFPLPLPRGVGAKKKGEKEEEVGEREGQGDRSSYYTRRQRGSTKFSSRDRSAQRDNSQLKDLSRRRRRKLQEKEAAPKKTKRRSNSTSKQASNGFNLSRPGTFGAFDFQANNVAGGGGSGGSGNKVATRGFEIMRGYNRHNPFREEEDGDAKDAVRRKDSTSSSKGESRRDGPFGQNKEEEEEAASGLRRKEKRKYGKYGKDDDNASPRGGKRRPTTPYTYRIITPTPTPTTRERGAPSRTTARPVENSLFPPYFTTPKDDVLLPSHLRHQQDPWEHSHSRHRYRQQANKGGGGGGGGHHLAHFQFRTEKGDETEIRRHQGQRGNQKKHREKMMPKYVAKEVRVVPGNIEKLATPPPPPPLVHHHLGGGDFVELDQLTSPLPDKPGSDSSGAAVVDSTTPTPTAHQPGTRDDFPKGGYYYVGNDVQQVIPVPPLAGPRLQVQKQPSLPPPSPSRHRQRKRLPTVPLNGVKKSNTKEVRQGEEDHQHQQHLLRPTLSTGSFPFSLSPPPPPPLASLSGPHQGRRRANKKGQRKKHQQPRGEKQKHHQRAHPRGHHRQSHQQQQPLRRKDEIASSLPNHLTKEHPSTTPKEAASQSSSALFLRLLSSRHGLRSFSGLLARSGLAEELARRAETEGQSFTLFAPTDSAIEEYIKQEEGRMEKPEKLSKV